MRILSAALVTVTLGACAAPAPDLKTESGMTQAAFAACRDEDPGDGYFECVDRFNLAHQQWNRDCRRRTISAADSASGRDEFAPWCVITASQAFFAQVIVEKDRTYFRNLRDFSYSCGAAPAVVVDGVRLEKNQDAAAALQRGSVARVQQQEPWPRCTRGSEKVISLTGLRDEVRDAEEWVAAQFAGGK